MRYENKQVYVIMVIISNRRLDIMCTVLLPIKPEYANRIIDKSKLYEYRKNSCKKKIDKIVIYSTAPVKKIIGEVEVKEVICDSPDRLWEKTENYSGISKSKYMKYFEHKSIAYAYKLGKVIAYDNPKELKDIGICFYPQSYVYLDN